MHNHIHDTHKNMIDQAETWPKVLKHNSEKYGDRHKAMRYKHYGVWRSYSWQDYYQNVKYLALGLLALGFKAGDKLLVVGDSAPEWYFAELAAQSIHGISVGLYSDLSSAEIKYIADSSEANFALVQDQEQVDKFIEIKKELPWLKKIIYWNYKGLSNYKDAVLLGYREVLELGRKHEATHPGLFEENVESGKPDDICALIYTSGTSGEGPKGAMHSHRTLISGSKYQLWQDAWKEKDNIICYLPPAWITEQWLGLGCHLLSGSIINFPESAETQQQDIREIGPTILLYNARVWERQAGSVQARIQGADFLKKSFYRLFMPVGYRMADFKLKKKKPGLHWRLVDLVADPLIFRPLRDSLGLPHARICYTAGARLSPEVIRFYHSLKVPLKSIYGSAEAGAIASSRNENTRLGTVGTLYRGTEVRIAANGEILTRQPGSFLGYYHNPEASTLTLKDGWVHSGDSGLLTEDGQLIFIDRTQDIVKLTCGENMAPQEIESLLKFSPYIKDVWITAGSDREFTAAVVIIDQNSVSKWADKRKVTYTTFSDLSQKPEIYGLIQREISQINAALSPGCRVKKFVNLHKEFDADEFELTRNRKLRRKFLEERYYDLIQAIYSGKPEILIEAQVRYRDGRTGILKTSVRINEAEEAKP